MVGEASTVTEAADALLATMDDQGFFPEDDGYEEPEEVEQEEEADESDELNASNASEGSEKEK